VTKAYVSQALYVFLSPLSRMSRDSTRAVQATAFVWVRNSATAFYVRSYPLSQVHASRNSVVSELNFISNLRSASAPVHTCFGHAKHLPNFVWHISCRAKAVQLKEWLGYVLDAQSIMVRFKVRAKDLLLLPNVRTDWASSSMGTDGSFPRDKAARKWISPLTSIQCQG
jgi:hypothetical protein